MNPRHPLAALTLLAAAALAACANAPTHNAQLDEARNSLRQARNDPATQGLPGTAMRDASDALASAETALAAGEDTATVDHLAYLARQRVALVEEAAARRSAEATVAQAQAARERLRLQARTQEADAAQRSAAVSQRDAQQAQRAADSSQRAAESSQRDARNAQQDAATAQRDLQTSRELAGDTERRNQLLQTQLRELNAKKTERGMVVTVGDVLFDTNRAELKSGSLRSMDKLVAFLKAYPQRKAVIEGFTDSVGGEAPNQALSARRAEAVRSALESQGVEGGRLATRGYGEAFPVAGNDNAAGRQMNRRVEIVLSDDSGVVTPR